MMTIKDSVANRNIKNLFHFTTIDNFISILEREYIYSRKIIDELKLSNDGYYTGDYVEHMDDQRLDNLTGFINLSISRPHWYLLNQFRKRTDLQHFDWCIIELNTKPLLQKNTLFSVCNAASLTAKRYGIKTGKQAFNRMFQDKVVTPQKCYERQGMPRHFTTDIQAEVLVEDKISIDEITNVYLENEEQLIKYKSAFKLLNLDTKLFSVKTEVFDRPIFR
ncbi:MAG: hypothetical protein ACJA0H_000220 [Francisellaceae bacterium]|jgi:hypothetical protein